MPAFSFTPEYFQIYTGEDRHLPLRIINIDGTPFSLVGATQVEARFKKADLSVLSEKLIGTPEVTKVTFLQYGNFYDVVGPGYSVQLYNSGSSGGVPAVAPVGHYFWFKITDGMNFQSDPGLVGTGHQVSILSADTANQIATKFYNAVNLVGSAFTATNATPGIVVVTNYTVGAVPDAVSANYAAAITILTQGIHSNVSIVNGILGQLLISIPAIDSSTLLVGERQNFAVVITTPSGIRKCNFRTAISVERQAV